MANWARPASTRGAATTFGCTGADVLYSWFSISWNRKLDEKKTSFFISLYATTSTFPHNQRCGHYTSLWQTEPGRCLRVERGSLWLYWALNYGMPWFKVPYNQRLFQLENLLQQILYILNRKQSLPLFHTTREMWACYKLISNWARPAGAGQRLPFNWTLNDGSWFQYLGIENLIKSFLFIKENKVFYHQ